jgi:hypothetical protein
MKKLCSASILALILLMAGCASVPQYHVNVDSIQAPSTDDNKSFVLLSGNKDTPTSDLQFREYAAYINRALISRGFAPAESIETANLAIFVVYGIGDPQQHQYSYSIPVWGQTGVSSSTTYGTLSTYGNYGTYSGTTTYNPTYGIKGYSSHVGSRTTYFRFVVLDAIDLSEYRKSKKEVQLWKTTVTSTGSSGDLRRVFPVMVTASKPHIATNSGQQIKVKIRENDPNILEIKGQVSASQKK